MINNIQFLRFIAAAIVVLTHSPFNLYGYSASVIKLGGFGVDIFFVISGFIIPYILFGNSRQADAVVKLGGADFFARRVIRIWPMYLLSTLFIIVMAAILKALHYSPVFEIDNVYGPQKLDFKLVLQTLTFATPIGVAPIVNVGWTLQFEFIFYSTVALLIGTVAKKFEHILISFCIAMLVGVLLLDSSASGLSAVFPPLRILAQPMMLEFIFGLLVYACYRSDFLLNKWVSVAFLVLTIPAFLYIEIYNLAANFGGAFHRPLLWGFLGFLMVWSAVSLEPHYSTPKIFNLLGDASYSMYLVHWLVLPWTAVFFTHFQLHPVIGPLGLLLLNMASCQLVAVLVHLRIEKPLNGKLTCMYRDHKHKFPLLKDRAVAT
ncbi:acyltransferase family protein [Pseudomonas protegens]|uniref:acyltransferase family protein n=1 Tax=Pseudomonas protegens TaxID=380021 RepID=UPI00069E6140|nr:acyltransferase [Pseudomonas protegens]